MNDLHPIFREAERPFAPLDADNIKVGHALRESANDGELTAGDLAAIDADATARAMDCLKRGFSDSLSLQRDELTPDAVEEEVRRIEADLHINQMKRSGEYDQRRLDRGQGLCSGATSTQNT